MEQETRSTQPVTGSENPIAEDINKVASPHAPTGSPVLDDMLDRIAGLYPDAVEEAFVGVDMPTIRVAPGRVVDVCRWLRDDPGLRFVMLSDLTCVDHLDREPRFDVVYHLCSLKNRSRVRVKTGIAANPAECPTMTEVWAGANWAEREVWDMYGVRFVGHPGLDRILSPEGWEYFALRRDFPLQGPGMIKLFDNVTDVF